MGEKVKRTTERSWIRRYRIWLGVVLLIIVMLAGLYCLHSYQKTTVPKDATLVDERGSYERKA